MRADRIEDTAKVLNSRGYALIESLAERSTMDVIAAELRPHFDALTPRGRHNATGRIHSRVLATAPELQQRMVDAVILGVMDLVLGQNCVRYQLSSVQGIEVHPGARDQNLHRDDDIFRLPHPHPVPESVRPMPEALQRLVGYELKGTSTLGWLDGRDPREALGLDDRTPVWNGDARSARA